tara:strand:- start:254 stop:655 length:402 start_codon:yes stop_codon:yes gene_type:complete
MTRFSVTSDIGTMDEEIKKVRTTEEEHNFMIELVYNELKTLEKEKELAKTPEEKAFYRDEELLALGLLRKILPDEEVKGSISTGRSIDRAKTIVESTERKPKSSPQFNSLDGDPINEALKRTGQAGCRGGDCD